MKEYYALSILFIIVPVFLTLILKYIYPSYIKSYRNIFKNMYVLLLAVLFYYICLKILILRPNIDINNGLGNFYLHAIGGGFVCAMLFFYITKCINIYIPYIIRFIIFFMFLCTLGVCNELLEFGREYFRIGIENFTGGSPRDTRQDLFANTVGGFIGFVMMQIFYKFEVSDSIATKN